MLRLQHFYKKKILNSKLLQVIIYGKKIILVKVQIRISNNFDT